MNIFNYCRTCLSDQNLEPLFLLPNYSEKYSNILHLIAGIKVEINDSLPQQICSICITFINKSIKFRKKCEESQKLLLENRPNGIKIENIDFKTEENAISIDISDYLDDEFKDYDDNITLDTLQSNNEVNDTKIQNENKNDININTVNNKQTEIDEKPINLLILSKKTRKCVKIRRKSKETKEKEKERIECEYCHKILTSKLSLRNHYKIHTGFDVVCEHCGKKFITRRLLLMHCRAKHGYEKTDKCSFCDYKASNAEQVKIHERLHTGEKPFVCKECNAGFHRKSSYLQHVAIHLPEKTVPCDQCPARFKSVTLMRIHKNRHRPSPYTYKCNICDNTFARRRNVSRHLQRVHGLNLAHDSYINRVKI